MHRRHWLLRIIYISITTFVYILRLALWLSVVKPIMAFDTADLLYLSEGNDCMDCDLQEADLRALDLKGHKLGWSLISKADLRGANSPAAICWLWICAMPDWRTPT